MLGVGALALDCSNDCAVSVQAPGAQPKVKCLLKEGEELELVEDHFSLPVNTRAHTCTCTCMYATSLSHS